MSYQRLLISALIVIVLIIIYRRRTDRVSTAVSGDVRSYNVIGKFDDSNAAAELISRVNKSVIELFRVLKTKYHIDETDDIISAEGHNHIEYTSGKYARVHKIVDYILNRYNPEVIYENDPNSLGETSYTMNKGDKIYFCLRSKKPPHDLVDFNTMMFVALHEIAHIGNYDDWGHKTSFWETFKFILHHAVENNIYTPVDYEKNPVDYCGLLISHSPLYDKDLKNIWE